MSTRNIHFKYRTPKRYPTIISIVPPGVALIATFRGSNHRCLEQIFMVPKGFERSKFDCIYFQNKATSEFSLKISAMEEKCSFNFATKSPSSLLFGHLLPSCLVGFLMSVYCY